MQKPLNLSRTRTNPAYFQYGLIKSLRSDGFKPIATITTPLAVVAIGLYIVGSLGLKFESISPIRYAMYLISPFLIVAPLLAKQKESNWAPRPSQSLFPVAAYLCMALFSLISLSISDLYVRDATIITIYMLLYATRYMWRDIDVKVLLAWTAVSLIMVYATSGAGFSINILVSASIQEKVDSLESFLGAIFVFYFLQSKRYRYAAAAVLICLLGGKRIAIGGLAVGLCFWIATGLPALRARVSIYTAFITCLIAIAAFGIYFPFIVEYAFHNLDALRNYQIEEFMAGRYYLGMALENSLYAHPIEAILFGESPGSADVFIVNMGTIVTLSHNDWLKILYDYGYIGLGIYLAIFISIFRRNRDTMALGIATATIMITDNVLIYLFFQIPLFILVTRMADADTAKSAPARA